MHLGGVEGVGDAVLLLADLHLGGAAHLDHRHAAAQLRQPLLQLLPAKPGVCNSGCILLPASVATSNMTLTTRKAGLPRARK